MAKHRISTPVEDFYLSSDEVWRRLPAKSWNFSSLEDRGRESHRHIDTQDNEDIRNELRRVKKTSLEMLRPLSEKIKAWQDEGNTFFFVAHTST